MPQKQKKIKAPDRSSREHITTVFRQMEILRKNLPKPKDKANLKNLINAGRRSLVTPLSEKQKNSVTHLIGSAANSTPRRQNEKKAARQEIGRSAAQEGLAPEKTPGLRKNPPPIR